MAKKLFQATTAKSFTRFKNSEKSFLIKLIILNLWMNLYAKPFNTYPLQFWWNLLNAVTLKYS